MKNRELLMLAQTYDPKKHNVNGWFLSEKYDGQRAIWIPHTRGLLSDDVYFANRARDNRNHVCTGLWSRYGKVIHAPNWYLDQFPRDQQWDGELYAGRGQHQTLRSIVSTLIPGNEWKTVKFMLLDMPSGVAFNTPGLINNPNYSFRFNGDVTGIPLLGRDVPFIDMVGYMERLAIAGPNIEVVPQKRLPWNNAEDIVDSELALITAAGGEGLILRSPGSVWCPYRTANLLKVKRLQDSEGIIVGFIAGKGKLLGMFGAMIVQWNSVQFELSGFTDSERLLLQESRDWALNNAGERIPNNLSPISQHFSIGESVTFLYRELTDGGIPKEARYFRKRGIGQD